MDTPGHVSERDGQEEDENKCGGGGGGKRDCQVYYIIVRENTESVVTPEKKGEHVL